MQQRAFIPLTLVLGFLTTSCFASRLAGTVEPGATLPPPSPTPSAVEISPLPPDDIPRDPTGAPSVPSSIQPTEVTIGEVYIYLVALEDAGRSGKAIGCGDSVIPVRRSIPPTRAVLRAALGELLSIHDQYYGDSGLYHALYQSRLKIDRLCLDQGTARIYLQGEFILGGVCDAPRVRAQLEETALQFPTVQHIEYWVNDVPLDELLSSK